MTNYILVEKNEMKTVALTAEVAVLAATNLNDDIAVTVFNPATKEIGLARTNNMDELASFISSIVQCDYTEPRPIVEIRLVGGNDSQTSKTLADTIIELVYKLNGEKDTIIIKSADVSEKEHPHSFKITAFDGLISELIIENPGLQQR